MEREPSPEYIEHLFDKARESGIRIDMAKLRKYKRNLRWIRFSVFLAFIYGLSAIFIENIIYKNISIIILTSFIIFYYWFLSDYHHFRGKLHDRVFESALKEVPLM